MNCRRCFLAAGFCITGAPLRFLVALAALVLVAAGSAGMNGQAAPAAGKPGGAPQLVILDTDIGDDIDDAFALALVLRSPELRLLGVTTAFGDTELRARLVERYLTAVGREDLPVVSGVPTRADNVFTQAAYARQGLRVTRPTRSRSGSTGAE